MSKIAPPKKNFSILPVLRVLSKYLRKYALPLSIATIATIAYNLTEVAVPTYYKQFLDIIGLRTVTNEAISLVTLTLVYILALRLFVLFTRRTAQFLNAYIQPRAMHDLTQDSFAYLIGHSYDFFTNNFTGSLVRKLTRLSRSLEVIVDQIFYVLMPLSLTLVGVLYVLYKRSPTLGLIFLAWVGVFIVVQIFVARKKGRLSQATAEKDSESTGAISDAITNEITVKLFTGSKFERQLFEKVSLELRAARIRNWYYDEYVNGFQHSLTILIEIVLMYVAINLWKQGTLTVGDFALIQAYLMQVIDRLWDFGHSARRIYEAVGDANEMVDILNLPHGVKDKPTATNLEVTEGKIEFRNTGFSYRMTHNVLNDFNLTITPKEKIALVGPSGAGKSTVVKLLFRFFDVTKNGIYIDGQNIAGVTQESLREHIALVPQEPILFHRTLMENIRYGRRDATDEEVYEAAKKAHCYEFISAYPEGFETYVGERGVKLSGGERQRVAIARAILKNAPILVLDEATSSLDSESEALIQDALTKLMEGKTVIVIAHRLSTIMKMDRIVVMKDGKVLTDGKHQDLIKEEGGLYKKLWDIQAGGFIPEESMN